MGLDSRHGRLFALDENQAVQGALVCQENATGHIKALIGGRDSDESEFNRAVQARRQPGSAFKPFIYAAAMDYGFTPADIIADDAIEYEDRGGAWNPQNYDRQYLGPMTLYSGLVQSRNVIAVRLMEMVGVGRVIETARNMGIRSHLSPYLSLSLGTSEVTLLEMVSAYSVFPNLGRKTPPVFITRIEDRDGRVIFRSKPERPEVLDPATAYTVLDMLKGVVQRGTGRRAAALGRPVAGKTGTTDDTADAWFIGFTPSYTTGVWVGRDRRAGLGRGEQGGRTAAPVFLGFMKEILNEKPVVEFNVPPGVTCVDVDPDTGGWPDEFTVEPITMCFKRRQIRPGGPWYDALAERQGLVKHVTFIYRDGKYYKNVEWLRPEEPGREWRATPVRPEEPARVPADDINPGQTALE
jgi:penicillin-binding protein 1A